MKQTSTVFLLLMLGACGQGVENGTSAEVAKTASAAMEKYQAPEPSTSYREAYSGAVAAIDVSARKGHSWTTADQLLEQAIAAADAGDEDAAMQLADRARVQAELAARQADREAMAWRDQLLPDQEPAEAKR